MDTLMERSVSESTRELAAIFIDCHRGGGHNVVAEGQAVDRNLDRIIN